MLASTISVSQADNHSFGRCLVLKDNVAEEKTGRCQTYAHRSHSAAAYRTHLQAVCRHLLSTAQSTTSPWNE